MIGLVVGDVHGNFKSLQTIIDKYNPPRIFQVGDFGYWPDKIEIPKFKIPVYWIGGNHENWLHLKDIKSMTHVSDNCIFLPTGTRLTINGKTILFVGGAKSVDWKHRKEGISVFKEFEIPNIENIDLTKKVDIVISHTFPRSIMDKFVDRSPLFMLKAQTQYKWDMTPDPTEDILELVLKSCKPQFWYGGHIHKYNSDRYDNCLFTSLGATHDDLDLSIATLL